MEIQSARRLLGGQNGPNFRDLKSSTSVLRRRLVLIYEHTGPHRVILGAINFDHHTTNNPVSYYN